MRYRIASIFTKAHYRVLGAISFSYGVSVMLFLARSYDAGNPRYWFLLWNAFLGLLPLMFALFLRRLLRQKSWLRWQSILVTLLWLGFLPNSFYLVTDLIHLHQTGEVSLLYDVTLFTSFIINGLIVGLMSVFLVHSELLRRIRRREAHVLVGAVFLACGFAIYLGRYLRWNSWDILLNPAGILFDVSSQFISPATPGILATTLSFFLLLSASYVVAFNLIAAFQMSKK